MKGYFFISADSIPHGRGGVSALGDMATEWVANSPQNWGCCNDQLGIGGIVSVVKFPVLHSLINTSMM